MVEIKAPEQSSPFIEFESSKKESVRFLGLFPKSYVKTFIGLLHAISSLTALILGNYVFIVEVIWGGEVRLSTKMTFYCANIIAAGITAIFFWNKVQSWQLSTTSMKEKGLSPQQLQNFNRGRGTLALLSHSLFPVVVRVSPQVWLDSVLFSVTFSLSTLYLTYLTFFLIKDYGKVLFLVYGMLPCFIAISVIMHGTVSNLMTKFPHVLHHSENQACFVLTCVQFGFMWYYLYSRRLASKEFVQTMCKNYHPVLFFFYSFRLTVDRWWATLPTLLRMHSANLCLLGVLFSFKVIKTQLRRFATTSDEPPQRSQLGQRRPSFFEPEGAQSRRRSSLFEAIDN
jgi:hypothetical protein